MLGLQEWTIMAGFTLFIDPDLSGESASKLLCLLCRGVLPMFNSAMDMEE